MQEISVHKLLEEAHQEKRNKNYIRERELLFLALNNSPNNIKVLNSLYRNLRRTGTIEEQRSILEKIYSLKKDGKVLTELIALEKRDGNIEKARFYLIEKKKIEPNNKKIDRAISKLNRIVPTEAEQALKNDIQDDEIIEKARKIIYEEATLEDKKEKILEISTSLDESIIVALLSELYHNELGTIYTKKFLKKIKTNNTCNEKLIKMVNELINIVSSKRKREFTWNQFWLKITVSSSNEELKVFKKYLHSIKK